MTKTLLGVSTDPDQRLVARHESGHLVMLWLLDRQCAACGAARGIGVTQQLPCENGMDNQHEHILYAIAGMLAEKNTQLLDELRRNITHPERFAPESDSYHIAMAIALLKGDPSNWLNGYAECVRRLLRRFSKPLAETTRLVRTKGIISFDVIHGLFQKWDDVYFSDNRPKSDLVGRTAARVFGWHYPRAVRIGWDLKPLPDDWQPPKKPTLIELAMQVRDFLDGKPKEK